jgi:hypothetical protein
LSGDPARFGVLDWLSFPEPASPANGRASGKGSVGRLYLFLVMVAWYKPDALFINL